MSIIKARFGNVCSSSFVAILPDKSCTLSSWSLCASNTCPTAGSQSLQLIVQKGNGAFAVEPEDAILGAPDHKAPEEQRLVG